MKHIMLSFLLAFVMDAATAQVLISDNRPDAGITLKPRRPSIDTVYIVLNDKVVTGIRSAKAFDCIYERTKLHEGNQFEGEVTFLIADARGNFTVQVKPLGWRYKEPTLVEAQYGGLIKLN